MEMYMLVGVLLLIKFIFILILKTNLYKQYMKEENGKLQIAEITEWKEICYTRPKLYILKIMYVINDEKQFKTIASSDFFLKKYKNQKYIRIITVPGTDFIFFKEKKWLIQNIGIRIIDTIFSVLALPLLLLGIIEILSTSRLHIIFFLFILIAILQKRKKKYTQSFIKHKSRMAYVTDLSYEEILNRLKMQTDINFQFEKESADNKDKVYILSVRIMSFFSKKKLITARYRLLVTPLQEGSKVGIYLFECSNSYVLHQFADKVGEYLQKEIQAFRVE